MPQLVQSMHLFHILGDDDSWALPADLFVSVNELASNLKLQSNRAGVALRRGVSRVINMTQQCF